MKKIKWHILGCLCYGVWVIGQDFYFMGSKFKLPLELSVFFEEIWVFYTFFAFLYYLFLASRKKKILCLPILLICFLGVYLFSQLYSFLHNEYYDKVSYSTNDIIYSCVKYITRFSIFSVGFLFFVRYKQNSREVNKLEQHQLSLRKEIVESELNFLRAQINPHFLQNCLNFIYSDTRKTNPNAADAVMLLSEIMRYSVADNSATNGMALLSEEATQVDNIIQIHQLRFEKKLQIKFCKKGNFENKRIVPMILLTLVENLIKYGDLNNNQYPAKIECSVDQDEKQLVFSTSNKKVYSNDIISTGLGLKNIRERLGLIWQENFTLEKEETDDYFTVKLMMPYVTISELIDANNSKTYVQ